MGRQRSLRYGAALAAGLVLGACGGGGGSASSASTAPPVSLGAISGNNVTAVQVRQGPTSNINIPYVTVTICSAGGVPGSSNCQDIPDVMVDTGSTGLRLFASVVRTGLALPRQTAAASTDVAECANFIATSAWGHIRLADVVLGGERAAAVPIQLMDATDAGASHCGGPPLLSTVTTAPNNTGRVPTNGTTALSANGILGVGVFSNDGQNYFDCSNPGTGCQAIALAAARQVQNPVTLFAVQSGSSTANNNGVVLQLPGLGTAGVAPSAQGFLIFGVNTQSNNQLGTAQVVPLNAMGRFTTTYRGVTLADSFMDSGSNGMFFPNVGSLVTACVGSTSDFFCPSSPMALSAGIALAHSVVTIDFSIANANQMFTSANYALGQLGGDMPGTAFDWGLPFFFGRSVFTVTEGSSPNAATGSLARPFLAFTN